MKFNILIAWTVDTALLVFFCRCKIVTMDSLVLSK